MNTVLDGKGHAVVHLLLASRTFARLAGTIGNELRGAVGLDRRFVVRDLLMILSTSLQSGPIARKPAVQWVVLMIKTQ